MLVLLRHNRSGSDPEMEQYCAAGNLSECRNNVPRVFPTHSSQVGRMDSVKGPLCRQYFMSRSLRMLVLLRHNRSGSDPEME